MGEGGSDWGWGWRRVEEWRRESRDLGWGVRAELEKKHKRREREVAD